MRALLLCCCAATVLTACSTEPTIGPGPTPPPDLLGHAFRLTMDIGTGRVTVSPPAAASTAGSSASRSVSLSLIGDEGIRFEANYGISCSPIPKSSPQQKRCSFEVDFISKFGSTDLITPTSFPRPPQGTNGILVFPFSAASDGSGGWAVPSPDWNAGPANFFNDIGNCSAGSKSDCYRYKLIPSPLYAREAAYYQRVGFDVPADAQNITAYVVVAADIRENPTRRVALTRVRSLSGWVRDNGEVRVDDIVLLVGPQGTTSGTAMFRSFVSFQNALAQGPVRVLTAELRFFPWFSFLPPFWAEHLDYGASLDAGDFSLPPAPSTLTSLIQCCRDDRSFGGVVASVQKASDEGRPYFQFRLTSDPDVSPIIENRDVHAPQLIIEYRIR